MYMLYLSKLTPKTILHVHSLYTAYTSICIQCTPDSSWLEQADCLYTMSISPVPPPFPSACRMRRLKEVGDSEGIRP